MNKYILTAKLQDGTCFVFTGSGWGLAGMHEPKKYEKPDAEALLLEKQSTMNVIKLSLEEVS